MKSILFISVLFLAFSLSAQKGKHGSKTIAGTEIVNEYTSLTANATAGDVSLTVSNSSLNGNGRFAGNLEAGDLLLIIQNQGVEVIGSLHATFGDVCAPNDITWGQLTGSGQGTCGNHEFVEVAEVVSGTQVNLVCGLTLDYSASGNSKTQVIRVPRFDDLIVPASTTLTADAWNGTIGGVLVTEVDGDATINGNVQVNAIGFRGGLSIDNSNNDFNSNWFAGTGSDKGGEKGESVFGFKPEYDAIGGRYGRGAVANGGGAGNSHNAGGAGGANSSNTTNTWSGIGVPDVSNGGYTSAWQLEFGVGAVPQSSGGGKGGYAWSQSDEDPTNTGPGNGNWGGHDRLAIGGVGGRVLDYSTGQIFFGGGGGGGHGNDGESGDGGNGGGIVFLNVSGNITGSGAITANGEDGQGSDQSNSAPFGGVANVDGSGGAGAGGAIVLQSPNSITVTNVSAAGGNGGNQNIIIGVFGSSDEAEGPGGGGGGGYIATSGATATLSVNGGANGITNAGPMSNFAPNGATSGDVGLTEVNVVSFSSLATTGTTICSGTTATLTATGSPITGATTTWFDASFSAVGTGATFTTPTLTASTTYYLGSCPGTDLQSVEVTVSPTITITGTPTITDESCAGDDGAIEDLVASGGTGTLTFSWNGGASTSADTLNAAAGSYTLTVTDAAMCTAISGPHVIDPSTGSSITINESAPGATAETCAGNDGTIPGLVASGGTGTITYVWENATTGATIITTDEELTGVPAGDYFLTVSDASGCPAAVSSDITIPTSGGPTITGGVGSDAICTSATGSINGATITGGATPYTFLWDGLPASSEDTTGVVAGSYVLTVTDANTCSTSATFVVGTTNSFSLDESSVTVSDETCDGNDGSIVGIDPTATGTTPFLFSWNGGTSSAADTLNATVGLYTLEVTDANGCVATSAQYEIELAGGPSFTAGTTNNASCTAANGSITAGSVVTGGTTPYSYQWNGVPASGTDTTGVAAGTYTLTITDDGGCELIEIYTVGVNSSLDIDDLITPVVTNESCGMGNGTISGISVTGVAPITYTWNGNSNPDENLANATQGIYELIATDDNGCKDSIEVIINEDLGPDLSAASITDETCDMSNGTITGIITTGGSGTISYQWNGIASALDQFGLPAGTYDLIATDVNGCQDSIIGIVVNNGGYPTADFTYSPAVIFVDNPDVTFTDNSSADVNDWSWTFDSLATSTNQNETQSFPNAGTYTVQLIVTNANGCKDSISQTVTVVSELIIPNIITPNGDGVNDQFLITGLSPNSFVGVYNRWGSKIFETSNYSFPWDGRTTAGLKVPSGTYYYIVIDEATSEEFSGFLHIEE